MKKFILITLTITIISGILTVVSFFSFDLAKFGTYKSIISTAVGFLPKNLENKVEKSFDNFFDDNLENFIDNTVGTTVDSIDDLLTYVDEFDLSENSDILNDIENFNIDKIDITKDKKLAHTYELNDVMDKIQISGESLSVKFVKSDKNIIEIYSKNGKMKDKDIKIDKVGNSNSYKIDEYYGKDNYVAIIYTDNFKNLDVDIKLESGVLSVDDTLKKLKSRLENGVLSLRGNSSYPIDLSLENGVVKIDLNDYNANIDVSNENGFIKIFGKIHTLSKNSKESFGNGKDNIKIKVENGIVVVE